MSEAMNERNAFVRRIGFEDVASFLPPVESWDGEGSDPDLLICALGFEDRAVSGAHELVRNLGGNRTFERCALIGLYPTNHSDNEKNRRPLLEAIQGLAGTIEYVQADTPSEVQRAVFGSLDRLDGKRVHVVFDISVASGTFILSVIHSLIAAGRQLTLDIIYCEPEEYFPKHEQFEHRLEELIADAISPGDDASFMERGVSMVDVSELHPGVNVENRPDHVIAVPAFRTSRLIKCLAHISDQPLAAPLDSIFWIMGEPPASDLKWRHEFQSRIVNRQLAALVGKEPGAEHVPSLCAKNHATCSTRDYREILRAIIAQVDSKGGENVWLVHMGSKLQAVGVALALAIRSEVTVLRARPEHFNSAKYSKGIGTLWRIQFGSFAEMLGSLNRVGTLEFETKASRKNNLINF
jgi:hypothetical protein